MSTIEITRPADQVARILERVLAGGTLPRIHNLQGIMDAHGWPDIEQVREQAAALRKLGKLDVTFDVVEGPRSTRLVRKASA